MKFIIRKAEVKDLDSIVKLFEKKEDIPRSSFGKEKREVFKSMLEDNSRYIFIGERNENISAFISIKIENRFENFFKPSAYVFDIKAENSDGEILNAVLNRAIAVAMENGCTEILLKDKNLNAKTNAVYTINGFKNSDTFFIKEI